MISVPAHAPVVRPRVFAARVESNSPVIPGLFEIALMLPTSWGPALPGQFVQLESQPLDAFGLRRPFSLAGCRATPGGVEVRIVYGVVGPRTQALARAPEGTRLALTGPFGRPFRPVPGRRAVLLGGGRGLAPVLMLATCLAQEARDAAAVDDHGAGEGAAGAEVGTAPVGIAAGTEIASAGIPSAGANVGEAPLLLHGARTAAQLIPLPDPPCPVRLTTDDGSAGFRGTLIDLLQSMLDVGELREGSDALFACGPNRMLAALAEWSLEKDLPCQVSLETRFGCGLGICAGCVVPVRATVGANVPAFERFVMLCREGPVMDAQRVDWAGVRE